MLVKTKWLALQPIREADLGDLVELLTDHTVKQTYMLPDFPDPEAAWKMAQRICGLSQDPKRYVAGIYLEKQLIGLLNETEVSESSIEVGYALLPRYHNRGYCTEALMGAIDYFFAQGFSKVIAGAFEDNTASIRVMIKSGMRKIDRWDTVEYRGKTHRCVYYLAERL